MLLKPAVVGNSPSSSMFDVSGLSRSDGLDRGPVGLCRTDHMGRPEADLRQGPAPPRIVWRGLVSVEGGTFGR